MHLQGTVLLDLEKGQTSEYKEKSLDLNNVCKMKVLYLGQRKKHKLSWLLICAYITLFFHDSFCSA